VALRNTTATETRKGDRALRRAVLNLQECLGSVPHRERRVLELRAGVGDKRTRSRAEVARLTGLHRKTVARLERRGLKRLYKLANAGSCARASSSSGAAPATKVEGSVQGGNGGAGPKLGVLGAARATPQTAESKSSDEDQSAFQAAIERPIIHGLGHTIDLGPLLLAFALGGLCYLVARELRRTI
jgi:hypothetical protein